MKKNILIAIVFGFYLFSPVHSIAQAGNLDSTFGINGMSSIFFYDNLGWPGGNAGSVVIQKDGKIILGGGSQKGVGIARFKIDGTIDSTFGNNGSCDVTVAADFFYGDIALQSDDKIVISGECIEFSGKRSFALIRLNKDGGIDNTFNGTGSVITSFNHFGWMDNGTAVTVQTDGKIIQVGMAQPDNGT